MLATHQLLQSRLQFYNQELQDDYALDTIVDRINGNESRYLAIVKSNNCHQRLGLTPNQTQANPITCCQSPMKLNPETSEFYCSKCGYTKQSFAICNMNQLYSSGLSTTTKYKYTTHARKIIARLQGKESLKIPTQIMQIAIDNHSSPAQLPTIMSIRQSLSQQNHSRYIINAVKIKYTMLQRETPRLTETEIKDLFFRLMLIAGKICSRRSIPYNFIIGKLIDLVVKDSPRKKEILSNLPVSAARTLNKNNKLWGRLTEAVPILRLTEPTLGSASPALQVLEPVPESAVLHH